jgi:hypothetical protein
MSGKDDQSRMQAKGDSASLALEEVISAALQTKPMTPEERKALEEEYHHRLRKSPGRKAKGQ